MPGTARRAIVAKKALCVGGRARHKGTINDFNQLTMVEVLGAFSRFQSFLIEIKGKNVEIHEKNE
jgi:hypothetical protein